ncbi:hypothetical protein [Streptomyces sp. WAC01280]|uniref:hypothetical protein n=1 Tax=Streptomyces sp. WAC01280 TaxID=2487424 RepID=UPI000F77EE0B|nr:hypothetical protein [Streptomyces sp. WAC01280]RSS55277.1 hypothetical protein EF909_19070 [Streptomyces sp. WAC01280]
MNVRYAINRRKTVAVVAVASAALLVGGCGAEEKPKADKPAATTSAPQAGTPTQGSPAAEEPVETLAVLKGRAGVELSINSAKRDAGGFLTIKGQLKNPSGSSVILPAEMRGNETEVIKHGLTLAGATLVDSVGKKRYYVLRDTDGRPLTTTGLDSLGPNKSTAVFMQFPAPPASTTEVSFQLPTFEPATLKLS